MVPFWIALGFSSAHAQARSGLIYAGAGPQEAGSGSLVGYAAGGVYLGTFAAAGGGLGGSATFGITDAAAVSASVIRVQTEWAAAGSGRVLVVNGPATRMAVLAGIAATSDMEAGVSFVVGGVAVERELGERVTLDAAAPLVGWSGSGWPPSGTGFVLASEVGLTVERYENHEVRFGLASLMPNVRYTWSPGPIQTFVTVGSVLVLTVVSMGVGAAF